MATNVKVFGADLRQTTIKVNPGDYLADVLEQACKKLGLKSDKFLLKHNQKNVDLSKMFMVANLPAGARLELIAKSKSPAVINIGLDLAGEEQKIVGSRRVTVKLPSDYTLWKVLRYFESETCKGKGLNLTQRGIPQMTNGSGSGQLYYETPVLKMEQRTFSTFVDFQKTLSHLGYNSGSVLIRLSFEKTGKTLVDAMSDITEYFKEEGQEKEKATEVAEKTEATPTPAPESNPASIAQDAASSETTRTPIITPSESSEAAPQPDLEAMDIDSGPQSSDPLAPSSVFSAPSSSTPAAAHATESDDAYAFNLEHAKMLKNQYQQQGQNKRLPSDAEIAQKKADEEAKLRSIRIVKVLVKFPDETSAEWTLDPDADGAYLYKAVRSVMVAESALFKLIIPGIPGAKGTIRDDSAKLIRTYGLTGPTKVFLVWDDAVLKQMAGKPVLKNSAASRAQGIVVPEVPEVEVDEPAEASAPKPGKPKSEGIGNGLKKLPKWLKLPGQKK